MYYRTVREEEVGTENYREWKQSEERGNEKPDETMRRKMMKEALKIVIETIMKNHIYNFDETLRRQKEGGAIGMDHLLGFIFIWGRDKFSAKLHTYRCPNIHV